MAPMTSVSIMSLHVIKAALWLFHPSQHPALQTYGVLCCRPYRPLRPFYSILCLLSTTSAFISLLLKCHFVHLRRLNPNATSSERFSWLPPTLHAAHTSTETLLPRLVDCRRGSIRSARTPPHPFANSWGRAQCWASTRWSVRVCWLLNKQCPRHHLAVLIGEEDSSRILSRRRNLGQLMCPEFMTKGTAIRKGQSVKGSNLDRKRICPLCKAGPHTVLNSPKVPAMCFS